DPATFRSFHELLAAVKQIVRRAALERDGRTVNLLKLQPLPDGEWRVWRTPTLHFAYTMRKPATTGGLLVCSDGPTIKRRAAADATTTDAASGAVRIPQLWRSLGGLHAG